ncbi:MAG TPA: hypothetical protein ENI57_06180 [Ignavibacteria bacterium]|nr:hypothetical protein [Ignavibacteria bacterium]
MTKRLFLILLTGIVFFQLSSCSDAPKNFGVDILSSDFIVLDTLNTTKDSVAQISTTFKTVTPLGASQNLLVGKKDNVNASFLIKFILPLADSIKTGISSGAVIITEAKVKLINTYQYGDSSAAFAITAHKVTSDWSSIGFTSDSLPNLMYDFANVSSALNLTDSIKTFNLDVNLIKSWFQSVIDTSLKSNKGLYVESSPISQKVLGFQAKTSFSINQPELHVIINKPGVYTDTLKFTPEADVSIVYGNLPAIGSGEMALQSGFVINSKLWFDISSLPKNAIINRARLFLTSDSMLTIKGTNLVDAILVSNIVDSTTKVIDSTLTQKNLTPNGNTYSGLITSFVQTWLNTGKNEGMLLAPVEGINGVDLFVLKGSNAPVLADRPRLEIIYTTKK